MSTMNIKKAVAAAVMTAALVGAMPSIASAQTGPGIPTFDLAGVAQAIATVKQLKMQYDQVVNQINMIKGNRGLGMIFNNPALRNYLPDNWKSVYDLANAGRLNGISGVADEIMRQEGMTVNASMAPGVSRYITTLATNKAITQKAYDAVIERLQNIQSLMQQSDTTQDPAAKADLANRFAAENAQIQSEQTRLNLVQQLQAVEEKLAARQANQAVMNKMTADE
ncbi:type IV secretion system protein [Burkholderia orbicola]|uniref:type IV secretion system protein n=1 Tax=Burkholderia cepacia complex TaxID=87882 RepID=UPI001F2AE8CC|nr:MULTISPECIES: type IV secretion system protein [Burkholderia cepacia complex]MDN7472545.1 type IV secretion system protein [Burkholderia orbicola]MDN7507507.1 type IV secretion system protein [Burkholderia orbicola]